MKNAVLLAFMTLLTLILILAVEEVKEAVVQGRDIKVRNERNEDKHRLHPGRCIPRG